MPLGVTLLELRRELRAETGTSLNPAQGIQAQGTIDIMLARQQRELWDAYNWQHLKFWRDIPLNQNQTLYSYPPEMAFDQITQLWVAQASREIIPAAPVPNWANLTYYNIGDYARDTADDSVWKAVQNHITGAAPLTFAELRAALPTAWVASTAPIAEIKLTSLSAWTPLTYGIAPHMVRMGTPKAGKPMRWRNVATVNIVNGNPVTLPAAQFELLPTPSTDEYALRFEGQAPLSPLVNDTDTCIIDSKAIVLFAAAEVMATQKNEAAPMKLTKAQNYLRRLLADQGADKRANYNMGGYQRGGIDPDKARGSVPYIDYIPS